MIHYDSLDTKNDNYGFFCGKIGKNLNEGYTEYLKRKMFDGIINPYKIYYIKQFQVAKVLEEIIGEEKIMEYFFTNNIYRLIEDLAQIYGTTIDDIKFLTYDYSSFGNLQMKIYDIIITCHIDNVIYKLLSDQEYELKYQEKNNRIINNELYIYNYYLSNYEDTYDSIKNTFYVDKKYLKYFALKNNISNKLINIIEKQAIDTISMNNPNIGIKILDISQKEKQKVISLSKY